MMGIEHSRIAENSIQTGASLPAGQAGSSNITQASAIYASPLKIEDIQKILAQPLAGNRDEQLKQLQDQAFALATVSLKYPNSFKDVFPAFAGQLPSQQRKTFETLYSKLVPDAKFLWPQLSGKQSKVDSSTYKQTVQQSMSELAKVGTDILLGQAKKALNPKIPAEQHLNDQVATLGVLSARLQKGQVSEKELQALRASILNNPYGAELEKRYNEVNGENAFRKSFNLADTASLSNIPLPVKAEIPLGKSVDFDLKANQEEVERFKQIPTQTVLNQFKILTPNGMAAALTTLLQDKSVKPDALKPVLTSLQQLSTADYTEVERVFNQLNTGKSSLKDIFTTNNLTAPVSQPKVASSQTARTESRTTETAIPETKSPSGPPKQVQPQATDTSSKEAVSTPTPKEEIIVPARTASAKTPLIQEAKDEYAKRSNEKLISKLVKSQYPERAAYALNELANRTLEGKMAPEQFLKLYQTFQIRTDIAAKTQQKFDALFPERDFKTTINAIQQLNGNQKSAIKGLPEKQAATLEQKRSINDSNTPSSKAVASAPKTKSTDKSQASQVGTPKTQPKELKQEAVQQDAHINSAKREALINKVANEMTDCPGLARESQRTKIMTDAGLSKAEMQRALNKMEKIITQREQKPKTEKQDRGAYLESTAQNIILEYGS